MRPSDDATETPLISVVICSVVNEPNLASILAELTESPHRPELIVSLPTPSPQLESDWPTVIWAAAEGGRAQQLNTGAAHASGDIIWLLHSDSRIPKNALSAIRSALSHSNVVGGAFHLRIDAAGSLYRIIESFINIRSRFLRMPYGDQGIFTRTTTFRKVSGFRDMLIMEDADFVKRAKKQGSWVLLPERIRTSARRWEVNGVIKTTVVNFITQIGFVAGISHKRLRRFYDGQLLDGRSMTTARPTGRSVRLILIAAALLALLIGCVSFRRDIARRLFGPPAVTGTEEFATDDNAPFFDHSEWDLVLGEFVEPDGSVDYLRLKKSPEHLDQYIAQLSACDFDALDRNGKLALLINAYNAFTMRLILDYYPINSIRDIPEDKRWNHKRWHVGSLILSLHEIEHDYLRERFKEPRIHFAINCASEGCPPLTQEAFDPRKIEDQLQRQSLALHAAGGFAAYDPDKKTLSLNPIYDWYKGDFTQGDDGIISFAAQFMPSLAKSLERGETVTIVWKSYDWGLNKTP